MSEMRLVVDPGEVDIAALRALWAEEDAALEAVYSQVGAPVDLDDDGCPLPGVPADTDADVAYAGRALADDTAARAAVLDPSALLDPGFAAALGDAGSVDTGSASDGFETLSEAGLVDALVAVERLRAWVDAAGNRLLAALVPAPASARDKQFVTDEIACALRQSPGLIALRIRLARELADRLSDTRRELDRGVISGWHAQALASATLPLDDATTAAVQNKVLPRAGTQTLSQFRASVRRAVHAADPRTAEERHARAYADRRVTGRPVDDGMGELWMLLALDDMAQIMDTVDAAARTTRAHSPRDPDGEPVDTRTLDQLRTDALVDLLLDRAHARTSAGAARTRTAGEADSSAGARADADMVSADADDAHWDDASANDPSPNECANANADVNADVRTHNEDTEQTGDARDNGPPPAQANGGQNTAGAESRDAGAPPAPPTQSDAERHTAAARAGLPPTIKPTARRARVMITVAATTMLGLDDHPAELDGYGPIPASVARRIAHDPTSRWRRLLTDPVTHQLLDYGRTVYRPPADLSGYATARDRTCRFPTCNRRATGCEIDHLHEWEVGGHTEPGNCECLCARHHHLKHEAGWQIDGTPEGTLDWTSPTGHTYRSPPAAYDT